MRFAFNLLLFFVAMALTSAGINRLLPPPRIPIVTPKLNWLAEHADDYDVFFIGSSRTFRQIIPEIFEAEMAAAGHQVRVFNAGVDGMRPPEDTYNLKQILSYRKKPLRWVFLESNPIRLEQRDEDRDTLRAVYWHDWDRLVTLYGRAFKADTKKRSWKDRMKKVGEEWPDFSPHLKYWMWNSSNLGRGHELFMDWMGLPLSLPLTASDVGKRKDGYKASSAPETMTAEMIADYKVKLAQMLEKKNRADEGDPISREEVRIKKRMVEAQGGSTFLVVPPFVGERIFCPDPKDGMPPIFDLSDPRKFAELYLPENRADRGHTNTAGSVAYTKLLAREFIAFLKTSAPTTTP